jgi:amidase
VLQRAAGALLARDPPPADARPSAVHVVTEAFALADADVVRALAPAIDRVRACFGNCVREASLGELCGDDAAGDLANWLEVYRMLQGTEVDSCLSAWIAAARPEFGPSTTAGFAFIRTLDRRRIGDLVRRRERFCRRLQAALGRDALLCLPTAPTVAPLKQSVTFDRNSDYYRRALSLTSLAGVARLPQVSIPLATVAGAPIGLSLIGPPGEDLFLVQLAKHIATSA